MLGYYFRGISRTLKMGVARAGLSAKRAAHLYTRKKKFKGRRATFSRGLPPYARNCALSDSEAEISSRRLGGSLQARGGVRSVQVCRARARRGKGPGDV